MFPATAHDIEFEFVDDIEALYANIRAFNRGCYEEVGYAYKGRMYLPPYIALADVDLALAELEQVLATGRRWSRSSRATRTADATIPSVAVGSPIRCSTRSGHASTRPGMRVAVHLGAPTTRSTAPTGREDPGGRFGDFDAFQWIMYWGDRPAMELTAGHDPAQPLRAVPEHPRVPLGAGHGLVPYTVRKMDHAFLMGRKAKWRRRSTGGRARSSAALRGRPVPRGERRAGGRRGRDRADRVRLRLPPRRGARLSRRSTSARS